MTEKVELDIDIAAIRQELKQLQTEVQKTGAEAEATFKSMMEEAQAFAKAQSEVTKEIQQSSAAVKQADQATGSFGSRVKNAILNQNVFGKSISEWGSQLKQVTQSLGAGEGAVGKFGVVFKVLGNIIKLSPIGLLAGVVVALVGYFTRFQSGIDKVAQVTAGLSATVNILIDRFIKLGSSIINFFSGNFTQAAKDLQGAVSGIGDELYNAVVAASDLEKRFQALRDASRTAAVESARINIELQKAKQIAEDTTQSFARRTAAARKAAELEKKIADQALDTAAEALELTQNKFLIDKNAPGIRDQLAQAEIDFANAQVERNNAIFEGESKIKDIRKEDGEQAKKRAEDAQKERDQLLKDLEKLRVEVQAPDSDQRAVAEVSAKYAALIKTAQSGVEKLNEIEKRGSGLTPEQIAQRKEFGEIILKLQDQENTAILDKLTELADKQIQIEDEQRKGKEAIRLKDFEAAKKSVENVKSLQESEIAVTEQNFENYIKVMKANGSSKEDVAKAQLEFDKIIQEARLKSDLEAQEKLLLINADGDEATIALIKNRIAKIRAELDGLSVAGPKDDPKDKPFSLGRLLGLEGPELDDFDKAVAHVAQGLQELTAARVAAAQAAVQASEDELNASKDKVDSAEEDLDRELALAELGFASDVTRAQQRLEEAKKQEAEAKAARERAIQDQKRAQRTQILLDSGLQASNIVTASTDVFRGFSKIPIVGVGLGIAAVALLIGSFLSAKAKALQATKAREGIQGRTGASGIVVGPSHEGGGVPLEVEGGEFVYQDGKRISVVRKSATATHFGLLQAINNDDRPAMARYLDRLTGGVSRNSDVGAAPSGSSGSSSVTISHADSQTHRLLEENNRLQRKIIELEESKETVLDMGDHFLVKKKGREERIEKRRR